MNDNKDAPLADITQRSSAQSPRPVLGLPLFIGIGIIVLFFVGFVSWGMYSPLDSAAIAQGEVSVETKRKTIQHLEGGIVDTILVRDGDKVVPGQVLIHLDKTQPLANLGLMKWRFDSARAEQARLQAERNHLELPIFPADMETKRATSSSIQEILETQESLFLSLKEGALGQHTVLNQRIFQYEEEIKGLKGQVDAQGEYIALSNKEIKSLKNLVDKGFSGTQRMIELQRDQTEVRGNRAENIASIARVRQRIAETEQELLNYDTTRKSEVAQKLQEVQSELFDLREKIIAAQYVLKRTDIVAPIAGTVVDLGVHTVGGVIAPGEALMDVVPTEERLIIEARISPDDIDVVEYNLPAYVRFTAFSQRRTKPVDGKVVTISADRLIDERTGELYYKVRIELTGNLDESLRGKALYPGMQAEVMILTGARTPLDYFIQPIMLSFNRAFREE